MSQSRLGTAFAVVLLSVAGGFALARVRSAPPQAAAEPQPAFVLRDPPAVSGSTPASPQPAPRDDFLGVVLPRTVAEISPRFDGKLRRVHVRVGDHVAIGAVLAEIDAPALRFDLRVAEAELKTAGVDQARAMVELAEAKERVRRRRALAAEALATEEEVSTAGYQEQLAEARLEAARARLQEDRAQVDRFRQNNEDTRIIAPFEGIVAARYVDPGAGVGPSTPILRLISTRDFFLRFAVPEARAAQMLEGQHVRARLDGAHTDLAGIIDKVAPEVDAASRLVFVEARLTPLQGSSPILSGETVRVSLAEAP